MSVKANWHLGDLDLPDDADPMNGIAQLQSSGRVVDLSKSSDALLEDLKATMKTEARLAATFDLTCADKWTVEVDPLLVRNPCLSCPNYTQDETEPRSLLCALGVEQEGILDHYMAARCMEALDADMLTAVEADFDAAQELAEAVL